MSEADQQGEIEKIKAEELIASSPSFDGIESTRIELGDDHTGDPAMWIVFSIRQGVQVDESWIKAFSNYSTRLGLKLLESGLTRFPYTRLEDAA